MDKLQSAINIAINAHDGQYDRGGVAYINHPVYVSTLMKTEDEIVVALLHDVIEDSDKYTINDLSEIFGKTISHSVDCITKRNGEKYEEYLVRVKSDDIARSVKLGDIHHNLKKDRIQEIDEKYLRMEKKYKKALEFLMDV